MAGVAPLVFAAAACLAAVPAQAQSAADLADLRAEIAALKAQQQQAAQRIAQLETALANPPATAAGSPAPAWSATPQPLVGQAFARQDNPAATINAAGGSGPGRTPLSAPSKLAVNGDLRVRYESNFGDKDGHNRDRGVVRARLRATYAVNKWLSIGGQIGTGDPNDPNSTDVTLSGFDNDLQISLDQAYIRANFGNLQLTAGKMPQPFVRTEMTWDGDINPEGVSASYKFDLGGGTSLRANGLYFLIDEAVAARDSSMIGGQLQFETVPTKAVKIELAAGYYDYRLQSTAGGDIGDFRTNRFAGGRYLSDFNLLDVVGAVQFNGISDKWPLRVVGNYVHNFGATTDQDTGVGVDILLGRTSKSGDFRFGYGYAQTGVDAVLAAFSHDNTDLATNYMQHTALVDYVVAPNMILNATVYRYKPKSSRFTTNVLPDDWIHRVRLNMLVNF